MAGLGPSTFRPSEAKTRYFWSKAGDIWTEAAGAARYGPEAGFSSLGLTPTFGRVSVAGNIAGFGSEPETEPGAIVTGPVPIAHPLRSSLWELGYSLSLFGASATPVQLDASTAYSHVHDQKQTNIVLTGATDRAFWQYFDKTGANVERWGPCRIGAWALNVVNSSVVASTWQLLPLQMMHYEGIMDIDTGTPTIVPIIRGHLSTANSDLAAAEQQLNLKVSGAPTGAGTTADPKVITFLADLGSTPSYGAVTFTVTCGPDAQGNPRFYRVVDSTTGTELGAPELGMPLEIAIFDVAGTGWADLDVVSVPLAGTWTPSLTTEPTLLSVHTCITADGTQIAVPESFDLTITNDYANAPGGFCNAMSRQHTRQGNLTAEIGLSQRWVTDVLQKKILRGEKVAVVVTINSGVEIDAGTSNETYKLTLNLPNLRPGDGAVLKSFPGAAADTSEALAYRAHPDSTIGDASVRATWIAAVANALS